jgi:hypothetical protein
MLVLASTEQVAHVSKVASHKTFRRTSTFIHMARHCSRSGCANEAELTLSYQYARSLVWLDDLTPEREPHSYDLCDQHARRLKPPSGWRLEDRRHRTFAEGATRLAG